MKAWFTRAQIWCLSALAGGTVLALGGCDPNVRDTVLGGVEGASTTLVTTFLSAFFQSITTEDEGAATTVRVFIDHAAQIFC